ncbi:hypothetical protein ABGB18_08840 [Nonomuraea sp. B12E4]|uniref:caspase, EACC1-associated type n=1 Tax=Nonomuraea sp. B12E4 TaxID=3153564 RepID=UPI00325C360E
MGDDEFATAERRLPGHRRHLVWNAPNLLLAAPGSRALLAGTARHAPGSRLPAIPAVSTTLDDLRACLLGSAGLAPEALRVMPDPATPAELSDTFARVSREATSTLLFYFVGHGLISAGNELHLATHATVDLSRGAPEYQALPYSSLRQVIGQSRAELVIVVLDCCFSGRAQGGVAHAVDHVFDSTGAGAYVLTSSSPDEASWVLPGERDTAFSGRLIKLLATGDPAGPPFFTLDTIYGHLIRTLPEQGLPRPRRQATDLGDRRAFALNRAYVPPEAPPVPSPEQDSDEESPYRGLTAFGPADADVFFGRDEAIASIARRVREQFTAGGPLVVTGPSGSGKSSILRAGVIPLLRRGDVEEIRSIVLSPGADPLGELARRIGGRDPEELRRHLTEDPRRALSALQGRWHLVIDQFEEVFTACQDPAERRRFIGVLTEICRHRPGEPPAAAVTLAVRADFFGHCSAYAPLLTALRRPEVVGPMTASQLRAVIEKPAARAGLVVERGLTDLLLEDLGAHEAAGQVGSVLPLLSYSLLATWQRRSGKVLTLAGYRASGGVARSLTQSAEETLLDLGAEAEPDVRRLLLRLVHLDQRASDTRRRVPLAELLTASGGAGDVLGRFVRARLITVDEDSAELTHEALIRAWPRLRTWIETDRADLLVRQRLSEDANDWQHHGRDSAYLYADSRLEAARAATSLSTDLTSAELAFLDASRRRVRRRRRLTVAAVSTLSALLLVATSAALYARVQGEEAVMQRDRALARQLVDTVISTEDRTLGGYLALTSHRLADLPETRGALLASRTWQTGARLPGHSGFVNDVAFTPDGRWLASASDDRTIGLWDVRDPARARRARVGNGHDQAVRALTFRPDGGLLASADAGGSVVLWTIGPDAEPRRTAAFRAGDKGIKAVAFDPRGRLLALASQDHQVRLWDVADPARPRQVSVLRGHTDQVSDVAFSPDGRTLASVSFDITARLWDVSDPADARALSRFNGHVKPLEAVVFAPDGRTLATGADDGQVVMWDVRDGTRPRKTVTLADAGGTIFDLAFGDGGRTMYGSSYDSTTWVWRIDDSGTPVLDAGLSGHTSSVMAVATRKDGLVATASGDMTVRLWRPGTAGDTPRLPRLLSHRAVIEDLTLSPDGRTMLDASDDGTARLWNVSDPWHPRPLGTLTGHQNWIVKAAFHPGGRLAATASWDTTVRLWDVADPLRPAALATLSPGTQNAFSVLFTKDGRHLVTGVQDPTVVFWNIEDPKRPKRVAAVTELPEKVMDMALSPDGTVLAMATTDNQTYLYDVHDVRRPVRVGTLAGHTSAVNRVRFTPDGRTVVTAGDTTARLWDVSTPARPRPLAVMSGHTAPVIGLAVSDDGRTAATAGLDNTLRFWDISDPARPRATIVAKRGQDTPTALVFTRDGMLLEGVGGGQVQSWNTDVNRAVRYICGVGGALMSEKEWRQHIPDLPYDPPCR